VRLTVANDQIDVRAILPQIRRPTLILHRRGDLAVTCANGRYLADHVPDAEYVELPGADHWLGAGDTDAIVDAIVRFAVTDWVRPPADVSERWLATVLFTDIIGSTEHAAKLGDRAWRDLLQKFHAIGRRQLDALRGREIDSAGDGLFAIFDGPARAIRCAEAIGREAKAIGIDVRAMQWRAFALSGAFAGLAGGLFAFSKGSISPETLAIPRSVDALVIVLLGGLNALFGPLIGAAAFTWMQDALARSTDYWRAAVGALILLLVLVFPRGIGGAFDRLPAWLSRVRP